MNKVTSTSPSIFGILEALPKQKKKKNNPLESLSRDNDTPESLEFSSFQFQFEAV